MNKQVKRILVTALSLSLVIPSLSTTESEAASKPKLSKKSVSIKVGKKKKIKVKGISKSKIKKTKWSVKSKKIVKLAKKKKDCVTIKGKKKGTTKLTAKIKVGNKTYKKNCKINVKKATTKTIVPTASTTAEATATADNNDNNEKIATATPVPTFRTLNKEYKSATAPTQQDADSFATTPPSPTVNPNTAIGYEENFDDESIGTTSTDAITGDGIGGVVLRGHEGETGNDYLEVVDGSTLDDNSNTTNVLRCFSQVKMWQGPMIDLTDCLDEGCTYVFQADVYCPEKTMMASYQLQTTESTEVGYGQLTGDSSSYTTISAGSWQTVSYTISIPDDKYYYALYFESSEAGEKNIYIDNITLTKTVQNSRDYSISSITDAYSDVFDIVGVGAGTDSLFGSSGLEFIKSQFNAYTPGNEMKPDALMGSTFTAMTIDEAEKAGYVIPDTYVNYEDNHYKSADGEVVVPTINFDTVDAIMKTCSENGIKLRGHTLVWHQQTPTYFFQQYFKSSTSSKYNTTEEVMDVRLEMYVKTVLKHILESEYSDCLYGYDVVNEYLHSSGSGTSDSTYWGDIYGTETDTEYLGSNGVSLRPKYVKKAFTWAHEMLVKYDRTDVKLFYNDYNCYQYPEDIVLLTDFINEDGQVCDGIGMQSHLDISNSFHNADSYAQALECFRLNANDLEIQVTEWDATMQSTTNNILTDQDQAAYYDQIMGSILLNKKNGGNITGVTLWSLYDGVSWRSAYYPCVFSGLYAPKSAYYALISAKATYWD